MTNAPGLRDQRLKVYARVNKGTDGFTSPVFVHQFTRWGRVDDSNVGVRVAQERLQMQCTGVAEFADEVTVPRDGIIVDELDTSTGWWIRGIDVVRATRRVVVGVDRISGEQFTTLQLRDAETPLGGTHLVNPS